MTRTSKKLKTVISLLAVVIVLSSIAIVPVNAAYTPYWQRTRAFIAAAITALNIQMQSSYMDVASIVEYVTDPIGVNYTYADAWQDRPEIQIWDDYAIIDGVKYTDIWISNEAAEKFRVNANDFKTAYQIASQSSGTFASGTGELEGTKIFNVNGEERSQTTIMPTTGGDAGAYYTRPFSSTQFNQYWWDGASASNYTRPKTSDHYWMSITRNGNDINGQVKCNDGQGGLIYAGTIRNITQYYDDTDFSYTWVAQQIPADEPLTSDTGMMIRIPSEDSQGNKWLGDFLTDYPEFNQGEPVTIDVNLDPDIMNKLDDLINIIAPIIPIINNNAGDVTFVENHDSPAPVQDTLLPDTWWSTVENKLDEIRQTIQNLNPDFSQIIQSIQTIPSAIQQAVSNITQTISNLGDTILRDIEEGPIRLLDKLIDVLRNLFFPILATLRGFLGIWHYVVTWMSNISAPFAWIMGLMTGASPILVSPIYALIAGIIVIAVYRRFGR